MYPAQILLTLSILPCLPVPQLTLSLLENAPRTMEPRAIISKHKTLTDKFTLLKKSKRQITRDNYQLAREAYEREVNNSISDYYAQRKAVMERYHARQREISEKFGGRSSIPAPIVSTTERTDSTSPSPQDDAPSNKRDEDVGFHRLGSRRNSSEETLVYQHNLGIGIKGKSDMDAAIEVVLDDPVKITCVELTPSKKSVATLRLIDGGPGYNHVKFKLTPEPNRGFSYTIRIWGLKY